MRTPDATRLSGSRRGPTEANLTPMIDVVFLLIIFFLVSSHLARRETRLRLELPSAASGERDTDPSPRLTIHVAADGALSLGATPVTPDELTERLAVAAASGTARVRLRGDRSVGYAAIEPALVACAEAGLEDISLAVRGVSAGRVP